MIDFTNAKIKNKAYAGANGGKIAVIYNGEQYMLKFPPFPTINKEMSYTNSCLSEYLGCKIFELVGIPVQETLSHPVVSFYVSGSSSGNALYLLFHHGADGARSLYDRIF